MQPTPEMIEAAKAIAEKITKAMEGAYDEEWNIDRFTSEITGDEWGLIVCDDTIIAEISGALNACGNGENAEYIIATQPKNMRVLLSAFASLAPQPVSVKLNKIVEEMCAIATGEYEGYEETLDPWTADNRADIDRWQVAIRAALSATGEKS